MDKTDLQFLTADSLVWSQRHGCFNIRISIMLKSQNFFYKYILNTTCI